MIQHFLYGNSSLLAIFLAALAVFVLGSLLHTESRSSVVRKVAVAMVLVAIAYVLLVQGRAGFIGLIAGLLFNYSIRFPFLANKRWLLLVCGSLILLLISNVFWVKENSSYGRILIYKISANIFQENWAWGIGFNNFKQRYNLDQAAYFVKNDINGRDALLADNSFYAFNDFWQLIIELGVIRFVCLAVIVIVLLKHLKAYTIVHSKKSLFYGSSSALLCIMVASFFSYPFHNFSIQLLSLIYFTLALHAIHPKKDSQSNDWLLTCAKTVGFGLIAFLCYRGFNKAMLIDRLKEASYLSRSGFKNKALTKYAMLYDSFKDETVMFAYAKQLYISHRLKEASIVLNELKNHYADNEIYKLSAAIAFEIGDYKQAEKDYLTTVYMVPNRMVSRYELCNFYKETGSTSKAIFWAKSILNMPVKIASKTTQTLKKQTRELLQQMTEL